MGRGLEDKDGNSEAQNKAWTDNNMILTQAMILVEELVVRFHRADVVICMTEPTYF